MNQTDPTKPTHAPGNTGQKRVATRDLVKIGQRWARGDLIIRITQIHRADREVEAVVRIKFADLRRKWRPL